MGDLIGDRWGRAAVTRSAAPTKRLTLRERIGGSWLFLGIILLLGSSHASGDPLLDFVCRSHDGAVPFREARSFRSNERHVKVLIEMLRDERKAGCWYNAVMTLGAIGTKEAVSELTSFVARGGEVKLSQAEFNGKTGAILALGWAANTAKTGSGNKEALDYLIKVIVDSESGPLKHIHWKPPVPLDVHAYLIGEALHALGLSGSEVGGKVLGSTPRCNEAAFKGDCDDALNLLDRAKNGLEDIYH